MSPEVTQNISPDIRNFQDLISRREALLKLATAGALALVLQPIMSMALAASAKSGEDSDRIVIQFLEREVWNDESTSVYYTKTSIQHAERNGMVLAMLVRDAPDLLMMPGVVIQESGEEAILVGIGSDTEYVILKSTREQDVDKYIDKIIEQSEREKKHKVVRYAKIIKNIYEKRKGKRKETLNDGNQQY